MERRRAEAQQVDTARQQAVAAYVEPSAAEHLLLVQIAEPVALGDLGNDQRHGQVRAQPSVRLAEMTSFVIVHALADEPAALRRAHDGRLDAVPRDEGVAVEGDALRVYRHIGVFVVDGTVLGSGEEFVTQQFVERAEHLDVRIEVDASVGMEGIEPDVVRREGPFALLHGLLDPFDGVDVEILLCPAFEDVVRHPAFPARHALPEELRNRLAAQPAPVDDLGYSGFVFHRSMFFRQ